MQTKPEIRNFLRIKRDGLSVQEKEEASKKIQSTLESMKVFKKSRKILFYIPFGSEVDLKPLLEKTLHEKSCFVPVTKEGNTLKAIPILTTATLKPGKEKVLEPPEPHDQEEKEFDLALIPALGFAKDGNRIGTGKGYYDRFLPELKIGIKLGIGYDFQVLESLPKDPYDSPVDGILTDKNLYHCNPSIHAFL